MLMTDHRKSLHLNILFFFCQSNSILNGKMSWQIFLSLESLYTFQYYLYYLIFEITQKICTCSCSHFWKNFIWLWNLAKQLDTIILVAVRAISLSIKSILLYSHKSDQWFLKKKKYSHNKDCADIKVYILYLIPRNVLNSCYFFYFFFS